MANQILTAYSKQKMANLVNVKKHIVAADLCSIYANQAGNDNNNKQLLIINLFNLSGKLLRIAERALKQEVLNLRGLNTGCFIVQVIQNVKVNKTAKVVKFYFK